MANATLDKVFLPKAMAVRKDLDVRTGDTVRVHVKIDEKGKTRIQIFEGLVLAVKHGKEAGGTFTVRKIASGVGVERVFPIYSPMIDKIEVVRRARTRRSKLYFLRTKVAREIRRKMRRFSEYSASSDDLEIPAELMEEEVPEEAGDTAETTEGTDAPASAEPTDGGDEAPTPTTDAPAEDKKEEAPAAETPEETKTETKEEAPAEPEATEEKIDEPETA